MCIRLFQEKYDDAAKYFEKAAEQGDLQAKFQLGVILYDGLGSKQDPVTESAFQRLILQ
jgi:TPR repeat protein